MSSTVTTLRGAYGSTYGGERRRSSRLQKSDRRGCVFFHLIFPFVVQYFFRAFLCSCCFSVASRNYSSIENIRRGFSSTEVTLTDGWPLSQHFFVSCVALQEYVVSPNHWNLELPKKDRPLVRRVQRPFQSHCKKKKKHPWGHSTLTVRVACFAIHDSGFFSACFEAILQTHALFSPGEAPQVLAYASQGALAKRRSRGWHPILAKACLAWRSGLAAERSRLHLPQRPGPEASMRPDKSRGGSKFQWCTFYATFNFNLQVSRDQPWPDAVMNWPSSGALSLL